MRKSFKVVTIFVLAALAFACAQNSQQQSQNSQNSSSSQQAGQGKKIKIGFAMDTLREERWQRDKQAFEKHCQELEVECIVTVANNIAERQASDVDGLLTQNIDVLVIAPHDATQAASMVEKAKAKGVPVISYDRLINSDKIDLYISHQVPVIGKKIAEYALQHVPRGNYMMVYGSAKDNNAIIMKNAMLEVLKPAIDKGDIKIVSDPFVEDWNRDKALNYTENALVQNNNNIQAMVVSNDGMAGGVISALERKNLTGILVTGQDAEGAALQRIAEGKQTMTVYKPIIPLANSAVEAAIKLAKKEPLTGTTMFKNDVIGKEVAAILLEVTTVDKDNLMTTVIKDGYQTYEEVYKNVPTSARPNRS